MSGREIKKVGENMKKLLSFFAALALALLAAMPAAASADIDRAEAEKLAAGFLEEICRAEESPETYKFDFSAFTSVEKLLEYMDLRMKWVSDLAKIQGEGKSDRSVDFEASATDFEEVEGGLLVTMHTKKTYRYADSDEPGISENSVYVLVAEGENGLEIRDYNNPHTGWDGIRGESYVPRDVDYWISSPDIEAALQNVRDVSAAGLEIYSEQYEKSEQLSSGSAEPDGDPAPETGITFSAAAIFSLLAAFTSKSRRS